MAVAAVPAHAAGDVTAYVKARAADAGDHAELAAAQYRIALAAAPDNLTIARRAYREGITAGDDALVDRAVAVLDAAGEAPPDAALLALATAVRARDAKGQTAALLRIGKGPFDFLQAPLAAWQAFEQGSDPFTILAAARADPATRRYADENRALLEIATGRIDQGVAALRTMLVADPANLGARFNAAQLLANKGRADTGKELLAGKDSLLTALRDRLGRGAAPSVAFGVSRLYTRLAADLATGEPSPFAILLARAALRADPGNDRARLLLAAALSRRGARSRALVELDAIPAKSGFHAAALRQRVDVLAAAGDHVAALHAAGLIAAGGDADDTARVGDLLFGTGRFDEAARNYRLAIERDGTLAGWRRYLQLGGALDQAGRWPEARDALERAVALAPDEPIALNYLGYARIERGERLAESQTMLERANQIAPEDASITDSLAWAYFQRGDAARALPLLERAARGDPANAEISEHLGDAYWVAGRRYEARYAWRAAAMGAAPSAAQRLAAKLASGLTAHPRR